MTAKFFNSGNVGIMGEHIENTGYSVGKYTDISTNIDWGTIADEIKILSSHGVDVTELNKAVDGKDNSLLKLSLRAAKLTKDFLVSVGASLLANYLTIS